MYITLLDREEREAAFVRSLDELDADSVDALRQCFAEYYRIPRITRLVESTEAFGSLTWHVETDHGAVSFRIRNRHSDIKCLDGKRVLVRDTNDNRYEIADYTALDAHSRHLLFSYL
jgi:Iap family predicted aminopeptidase